MDFNPPVDCSVDSLQVRSDEESRLNTFAILAEANPEVLDAKEQERPKTYDDLDEDAKQEVQKQYYENHDEPPIGDASMDKAETIFLRLRRAGSVFADADLEYKKGSTHYNNVLDHLGGMKPGDIKLVAPWPDDAESSKNKEGNRQ